MCGPPSAGMESSSVWVLVGGLAPVVCADPSLCPQESQSFPESYPELPKKDTVESSQLQKHVLELAAMLEVQSLFWEEPQETY